MDKINERPNKGNHGRNIKYSDRGTQYCCDRYVSILKMNGIRISMTQSGSPYDNAIAERVNGILKAEFDLYRTFKSLEDARRWRNLTLQSPQAPRQVQLQNP